ncbi:EAL domain-containing protein [Spirulina sp. 06S082]|uniref:sensor domain-containing protein n=1 Tax=Spirulina sp. 06S082 TaxID=3110248 RepID=UPI002B1F0E2E|nr:EAL domain-containing protein [Spirulina sp. 06S082]MEA5467718.1 EAL domain-containing protein [Spirulina sp. 06S082]
MKNESVRNAKLTRNIVGFYVIFSSLWVFLSDNILLAFAKTPGQIEVWQFAAGIFYVLITSILFFKVLQLYTREAEKKLAPLEDLVQRYQTLFEKNPQPMWVYDTDTMAFLDVNNAAIEAYGYSRQEFLKMTLQDIRSPEDIAIAPFTLSENVPGIWQHYCKDGSIMEVEIDVFPFLFAEKPVRLALLQNVTERQRTLEAIKYKEEQYRTLASNFPNGAVVLYDKDLRYTLAEGMEVGRLGRNAREIEGKTLQEVVSEETYNILEPLYREALTGMPVTTELPLGDRIYLTYALPVFNQKGEIEGGMSVTQNITQRKQMEEQLQQYAFYDTRTKLPNKTWFLDRLSQQLLQTRAGNTGFFTVLFLQLERFSTVKYSLGHRLADRLMLATKDRLETCLNLVEPVARVGDKAIATILMNIHTPLDAAAIAQYIQEQLSQPLEVDGQELFSPVSIGIAIVDSPLLAEQKPETLLQAADTAMNHAKYKGKAGKVSYAIFEPKMYEQAVGRFQLETDLRLALKREGFSVFYQPIVAMTTGCITGFEAVVRWLHPSTGWMSPGDFIPVAEETGLIGFIDWWVLGEACKQLGKWQKISDFPLTMSVNASGALLSQFGIMERLRQVTKGNRLLKESLRLEVTERVMMEHYEATSGLLEQIKNLKIRLSVDDFGTGYSCLERLHQLPIDTLKIDRSFVGRMLADEDSLAIVRTIIALAHSLKMDTIAEGTETQEQLSVLEEIKCEYSQGFYFSPPVASEEAEQLLKRQWQW